MKMKENCFNKVTAFLTKLIKNEIYLLVFNHPLTGYQLPAGSVNEGEYPEDGAARELFEEAGISKAPIISLLDVLELRLNNTEAILSTDVLLLDCPNNLTFSNEKLSRGLRVNILESFQNMSKIRYTEYDHTSNTIKLLLDKQGWANNDNLQWKISRYFYHFDGSSVDESNWSHNVDGNISTFEWKLLDDNIKLFKEQQQWLDLIKKKLIIEANKYYEKHNHFKSNN